MVTEKGGKTRVVCIECGYRFMKYIRYDAVEVQCPKCHGYDTELN